MIREILEQNIHEIQTMYIYNKKTVECILDNNDYLSGVGKTEDEALEYACRQYVKENGFKLEWFGRVICWADNNKKYIQTPCLEYILGIVENGKIVELGYSKRITKLIAWLYANDIEVIK